MHAEGERIHLRAQTVCTLLPILDGGAGPADAANDTDVNAAGKLKE